MKTKGNWDKNVNLHMHGMYRVFWVSKFWLDENLVNVVWSVCGCFTLCPRSSCEKMLVNIIKTLPRDCRWEMWLTITYFIHRGWLHDFFYRIITRHIKSLLELRTLEKNGASVGKVFDERAKKNPGKPAILFKDEVWTFQQVHQLSHNCKIH